MILVLVGALAHLIAALVAEVFLVEVVVFLHLISVAAGALVPMVVGIVLLIGIIVGEFHADGVMCHFFGGESQTVAGLAGNCRAVDVPLGDCMVFVSRCGDSNGGSVGNIADVFTDVAMVRTGHFRCHIGIGTQINEHILLVGISIGVGVDGSQLQLAVHAVLSGGHGEHTVAVHRSTAHLCAPQVPGDSFGGGTAVHGHQSVKVILAGGIVGGDGVDQVASVRGGGQVLRGDRDGIHRIGNGDGGRCGSNMGILGTVFVIARLEHNGYLLTRLQRCLVDQRVIRAFLQNRGVQLAFPDEPFNPFVQAQVDAVAFRGQGNSLARAHFGCGGSDGHTVLRLFHRNGDLLICGNVIDGVDPHTVHIQITVGIMLTHDVVIIELPTVDQDILVLILAAGESKLELAAGRDGGQIALLRGQRYTVVTQRGPGNGVIGGAGEYGSEGVVLGQLGELILQAGCLGLPGIGGIGGRHIPVGDRAAALGSDHDGQGVIFVAGDHIALLACALRQSHGVGTLSGNIRQSDLMDGLFGELQREDIVRGQSLGVLLGLQVGSVQIPAAEGIVCGIDCLHGDGAAAGDVLEAGNIAVLRQVVDILSGADGQHDLSSLGEAVGACGIQFHRKVEVIADGIAGNLGILRDGQGVGALFVISLALAAGGNEVVVSIQCIAILGLEDDLGVAGNAVAGVHGDLFQSCGGIAGGIAPVPGGQTVDTGLVGIGEGVAVTLEDCIQGAAVLGHQQFEGALHHAVVRGVVCGALAQFGVAPLLEVVAFHGLGGEDRIGIGDHDGAAGQAAVGAGQSTALGIAGDAEHQGIRLEDELDFHGGGLVQNHIGQAVIGDALGNTVHIPVIDLVTFIGSCGKDHTAAHGFCHGQSLVLTGAGIVGGDHVQRTYALSLKGTDAEGHRLVAADDGQGAVAEDHSIVIQAVHSADLIIAAGIQIRILIVGRACGVDIAGGDRGGGQIAGDIAVCVAVAVCPAAGSHFQFAVGDVTHGQTAVLLLHQGGQLQGNGSGIYRYIGCNKFSGRVDRYDFMVFLNSQIFRELIDTDRTVGFQRCALDIVSIQII